ncbi:hypothetical protein EI94DRAFT_1735774 [Lactarius quietus]|nr:hypothetical protein EI94DRAFT_1735774 [Lactarius quietus]
MQQIRANHDADEDDDHYHDRAQRRRKRRRVLVVVLAEVLHRREERTRQRNMHRTYLTRPDLNPSPRIGTPWQHLYARGNHSCSFKARTE